ncbi:MAG: prohibitin family protein [Paludibacteraceae bacterium]|nr:prohibitin family protein [Paludibacteraceae bacterium]MBR4838853.1 prohibitin family protein [Paludibacteraceae bacterium]
MAQINNTSAGSRSSQGKSIISTLFGSFKYILIAVLALVLFIIAKNCCTTIDSGSVGIKFYKWSSDNDKYGGVIGTCKGWVWYNPITQNVFEYPIYVQRKNYQPFAVNAKDASIFTMDPTLAYRLDPGKATQIFTKYRRSLAEIEDGYIRTCIYEAYRTCANQYTSDSLMANRGGFESGVRMRLDSTLSREGFIVEEFTSQITPPNSLAEAINAKNEAVQNALKAENKVKEAEAEAKIQIAKAKGEADALKIKGDGEAYYNRTVAMSLNELLVRQYALEKWDGKLPTYMSGEKGAMPIIGLK